MGLVGEDQTGLRPLKKSHSLKPKKFQWHPTMGYNAYFK